jgi:excisionase family DNA binding protein
MDSEVLTIKEVAEYLKVNERTIYRLAASNELPGFRVGNAWRFKRSDLDTWVLKQTEQAAIKE